MCRARVRACATTVVHCRVCVNAAEVEQGHLPALWREDKAAAPRDDAAAPHGRQRVPAAAGNGRDGEAAGRAEGQRQEAKRGGAVEGKMRRCLATGRRTRWGGFAWVIV